MKEFSHSIFLCGAIALLTLAAHFSFLTLTFKFVTCGGLTGKQKLAFCRYFPCCYDAIRSHQTPGGGWEYFSLRKAAFLFPAAQFLPVLHTFTSETKAKQNRHGPCCRWRGGVFLNLAEAIRCFHRLRCLQLLSAELFILITSLVFFHHVHVWLDWYGCMCVRVCVCSIDVSTGKHNSVNYYRITSIFIASFFLLRRRILEKCLNVEM